MTPLFAKTLEPHGDAPALIVDGRPAVTYADLARRTADMAGWLGPGKRLVAVEAAASEHAVVAYLGALAGGHAVILLPADDRRAFDDACDRFSPDAICRPVGGRWRVDIDARASGSAIHPDLALILTTSGSTGHGKAVRLSGAAVGSNAVAIADYLGLRPDDRAGLILPLHYSYGLSVLNAHLAVGASVHLAGRSVLDDGFVEAIEAAGCTSLSGVPLTYDLLERIGFRSRMPAALRTLTVAGGRLAPETVRTYARAMNERGGRFFVMYGQTEATARIAYLPPELAERAPDRIGRAIPGGELSLRTEAGRTVSEPETVGELVYRGPNVMMGYADGRDDLARGAEVSELATGDLAVVDAEGLYRIVGRTRRMSKIAGVRIGHDALEAALAAKGVTAAVTGTDEALLVAFTSGEEAEAVRRLAAEAARVTLRHVRAVRLPELPRLASGKVDYGTLEGHLGQPKADPRGVAEGFRQAFFPHPVSPRDSFASLGGDSLRYVEITMLLERRLGRVPPGWERMSVADLSGLTAAPCSRPAIGTDLLIRALAILFVVVQHATLWPIPGGAASMVMLIGFGLARFQKDALAAGDFRRFFRPLALVLAPYYAIVAGYAAAWGEVPWASVFLVGNFGVADPERHSMLPFLYWFVEVYAQILLVLAGLFLLSRVRSAAARNPFRFGLGLLAGAVALRAAGPAAWPIGSRQIFTLPWVFYLCAFGWCAALADTARRRLAVLGLAAAILPLMAYFGGNWTGAWVKFGLVFAAVTALLYAPSVRLPAPLASAVLSIATGSYAIYLLHRFVPEVMLAPYEASLPQGVFTLIAIIGGVLVGLAANTLQRRLFGLIDRLPFRRDLTASPVAGS